MKDPAFLFYPQDFVTGTMFFTFEQKGKYINLLCAQHQMGGILDKSTFNQIVGDDQLLRAKFIETEDGFFNERLMKEIIKRSVKSTNLSANAKIRWDKHKQKQCESNAIASALHMPIEDENVNENVNEDLKGNTMDKIKLVKQEYFLDLLPIDSTQQFIEAWNEWADFRREIKKKLTKSTAKKQITFLLNQPDPIKCINQSIQNGWVGLFEERNNNTTKSTNNRNHEYIEPKESKYDYK